MQVDLFNDELPLLVFLAILVGFCVRPTDQSLTSLAKDVTDTVQTSDESSIFCGA